MLSANAQSTAIKFQSPAEQTALVELYTSEGCSSCPPAETWLSRWRESPGLWKDFVPVAFHVDYWDYLGWRDHWGDKSFSDRQREYARQWRNESIYTPGFVLNGQEWQHWRDHRDGPKPRKTKVGVLAISSSDTNVWQATFTPFSSNDARHEVHFALLACGLSSEVKAGENRGRRLEHDFVVLKLANSSLAREGDFLKGECVVPLGKSAAGTRLAIAAWITRKGDLEPLQATGGWLARRPPVDER